MKILFLGDIVASAGRKAIAKFVPELRKNEKLDLVIANGENVSHGKGIDPKTATTLFDSGVDVITGGNHSWDKKEALAYIQQEGRLLRPANYPDFPGYPVPGKGHHIVNVNGTKLGILNVMGRVHMEPVLDCPFQVSLKWIQWFEDQGVKCIFVDFHGEATSEKQAYSHFFMGRVSAIVGTHTHVQTADEKIYKPTSGRHMAYITDAGMTGPYDSVIGVRKDCSIPRFLSKLPAKYEPAEGRPGLHGVIIEIEDHSGSAFSIKRVSLFLEE